MHEYPDKSESAKIGIALGSGSARGWAHIGIIQALESMGIEADIVAGSSIGALVGGAYANHQLDDIKAWAVSLNWKEIMSYLDVSLLGGGVIEGGKLFDFFRQYVADTQIESMPRRFAAVATELETGREVWMQQGDLLDAVRASIALPGLFTPYWKDGRWLVDGGLVDPVPVSLCRAMGADIVIAVNLNGDIVGKHSRKRLSQKLKLDDAVPNEASINKARLNKARINKTSKAVVKQSDLWDRISQAFDNKKQHVMSQLFAGEHSVPGLFDVMAGSINIMQDRITRSRMAGDPPDIILSPQVSQLGLMEFDQAEIAIAEGEACVQRMQDALQQIVINNGVS